jgi:DNA-directed RNA polymerase specialized sigma24 family protein
MERRPLEADDARMIMLLADDTASVLVSELPADQRAAIAAHVVDARPYTELAGELQLSEAAVRQRVSRGLATLRRRMGARR